MYEYTPLHPEYEVTFRFHSNVEPGSMLARVTHKLRNKYFPHAIHITVTPIEKAQVDDSRAS